jgi:hypothetical protein
LDLSTVHWQERTPTTPNPCTSNTTFITRAIVYEICSIRDRT